MNDSALPARAGRHEIHHSALRPGPEVRARGIICPVQNKRVMTVRKYRLGEEPMIDEDVMAMTPEERVALVWEITRSLWTWQSGTLDEPPFRRDVENVIRGRR